jgi:hypothetical protein
VVGGKLPVLVENDGNIPPTTFCLAFPQAINRMGILANKHIANSSHLQSDFSFGRVHCN